MRKYGVRPFRLRYMCAGDTSYRNVGSYSSAKAAVEHGRKLMSDDFVINAYVENETKVVWNAIDDKRECQ
jgi:hypothetical protein